MVRDSHRITQSVCGSGLGIRYSENQDDQQSHICMDCVSFQILFSGRLSFEKGDKTCWL